jgi:hypothetical protein
LLAKNREAENGDSMAGIRCAYNKNSHVISLHYFVSPYSVYDCSGIMQTHRYINGSNLNPAKKSAKKIAIKNNLAFKTVPKLIFKIT